ncbi:MAG: type II and III secretion system protein family protein, partial [Alphaproteobacteria bacterium]
MTRSARTLLAVWAAAALFAAGPANAQDAGTGERTPLGATEAASVPNVVNLGLNKARVYELPQDARDVLVSNPTVADVVIKTPRRVYVLGQAVGDTNAFFFDGQGREILRLEIRVELDLSALQSAMAEYFPDEHIVVRAVNQDIVLSGTVRSAQVAEDARLVARRFVVDDSEIVNLLRIANEQQVMLRVRVSEMQRTVVKELGVQFFLDASSSDSNSVFDIDSGGLGPNAFGTARFLFNNVFDGLDSTLDALESQGLVKTLAEPNLTAVSGENANFLVGGEFPIPVPQEGDQITIEFKQFGILLTFTPVVLSSGVVSLKISTEVSQLSTKGQVKLANFNIPSLTVNRAETTVELPSGGGFMIAGLLQNDIRNRVDGIPGMKDIPILGALFRSVAFRREETELVVTVTPYLVRPVDPNMMALPTDGFAPASDFDMYLLGR